MRETLGQRDSLKTHWENSYQGGSNCSVLTTSFQFASSVLQNSHCMQLWAQQLAKRSSVSPISHLGTDPGPSLFCSWPEGLFNFPKIQKMPLPWVFSGPCLLSSLYPPMNLWKVYIMVSMICSIGDSILLRWWKDTQQDHSALKLIFS